MWLILFLGIGAIAIYEFAQSQSSGCCASGAPAGCCDPCSPQVLASENAFLDGQDGTGSGPMSITFDESTWPSGNRVWNVCRAIARAEGANVEGSNPDRLNNPGDISDGGLKYGFEFHSGSSITRFPDKQTGWAWLYQKVSNIVAGKSTVYSASWTWTKLAQKWAGNWKPWVAIVTGSLGVSPDETVGSYFA